MRFIHTADWHLGKLFGERYMTNEQRYVLSELLAVVRDTKAEAVVIAGDIYDRAVPPTEAVDLFSDTLSELAGLGVKVLFIAGNHDSASRLDFGASIMRHAGIYLAGKLDAVLKPVELEDKWGKIYFSLFPYAEPPVVRAAFALEGNLSFDEGMKLMVYRARKHIPDDARSVAVAHAFIMGGETSESERPLAVGGSEQISYRYFLDYNYTALGHLHKKQRAGTVNICYSGSLLKYSFDEADHIKGVTLVDIDAAGEVKQEFYQLRPRHEVRIVKGTLEELLTDGYDNLPTDDFVRIDLLNSEPVLFPFEKLSARYKNLFAITRPNAIGITNTELAAKEASSPIRKADITLFAEFFRDMTETELTPEESAELAAVIDEINRKEREA